MTDQECKGSVRIPHNEEQRRFLIAQRVQFQLVIHGDLRSFLDVEGSQSGTAGNEDGFAVFPETKSQGLFHQIQKEVTFCGLPHGAYA